MLLLAGDLPRSDIGLGVFRAPTLEQGNTIILAMLGFNGAELPAGIVARMGWVADMLALMGVTAGHGSGSSFVGNFLWVLVGALGAVCLPNVAQIFHHYEPVLYEHEGSFKGVRDKTNIRWSYSMTWASITAFLGLLGVLTLTQISEFLYFQF